MWKEVPRTRKKEVLSSHHVESSRPSLTTVSLEVQKEMFRYNYILSEANKILLKTFGIKSYVQMTYK